MQGLAQEPLIWREGLGRGPAQRPTAMTLQAQMRLAAQFAARNDSFQALASQICHVAAKGLNATLVKLLVYNAEDRAFVIQGAAGSLDGIDDTPRPHAGVGSAAALAWYGGRSIVSNGLVVAAGFCVPAALAEHGIVRTTHVVVPGEGGMDFGVLEVGSPEPGTYTKSDRSFLQVLALSLAAAISQAALRELSKTREAQSAIDHQVSLRELQHRIRNDFQVIYAVAAREAGLAADPAAIAGFGRVGRRVLALSEVYNHLLGQDRADDVDMGTYLPSLCSKIADAADLPSRAITLAADTQRLMLRPNRAVMLAIAVTELATNAIEHAFPDKAPGSIALRLVAENKGGADSPVLSVTDDGCGFNGPRSGSSGLTFVERLVHRAGGVLDREDGGGTRWNIRLASYATKKHEH